MSREGLEVFKREMVGLGYVGLPLAEAFANVGFNVRGYDTDALKVDALKRRESYIRHIGNDRIRNLMATERFEPTCDPDVFAGTDVVIICVPTPLTDAREPDLSYVISTGKMLSRR